MSETTPETPELRDRLAEALSEHAEDGAGDCACSPSWQELVEFSGAHLADALLPVVAQEIAAAEQRWREEAFVGAADNPGPENAVPTPAQLLRRLFDGSAEQRIEWAHRAIENSEKIHRCFMQNHDGRIAYLEREVRELRAALAETAPEEGKDGLRARIEALCVDLERSSHGGNWIRGDERRGCVAEVRAALAERATEDRA